jgi:tetratricopeptide (TPR) repeat protein
MRKSLRHLLLITVVGLIAYSNTFHVPFQFDDYANITENPIVQRPVNFTSFTQWHHANPRRYVGDLTFALNYALGGLNVVGYHLVNIAVHIATALLLYFLVLLTFRTPHFRDSGVRRRNGEAGRQQSSNAPSLIALFTALLFVSHPVQTEAVTYIVQRLASLAAMFYLLSMVMYVKGRLAVEKAGEGEEGGGADSVSRFLPFVFFLLSLLSSVLAMMTKEISFTLPIVIVLYEFMFFKSSLRKKLLFLIPVVLTIVIIPLSILGIHRPLGEIISDISMQTRVQTSIPRWDYLLTEFKVVTAYIRLLFFPVNQNLDYDYPVAHSLLKTPVLLSLLFLAAVLGTAVHFLYRSRQTGKGNAQQGAGGAGQGMTAEQDKRVGGAEAFYVDDDLMPVIPLYRLAAFGIFFFFIALSVESSLIPIADVMFEHRVYLPSAGAFLAIASVTLILLSKVFREKMAVKRVFIIFFSAIVAVLCLATLARNAVWQSELSLWTDVVRKSPRNPRAYNNIGYFYLGQGRTDEALRYFHTATRLSPYYADAQDNAGVALYEKGLYDAAIGQFMKAVSLMPDVADFHHNLGLAYVQKGLPDDALAEFETALKLSPDSYEIYNDMGVIYRRQGHIANAIESFEKAIKLNPYYAGAHYNLGLAYQSLGVTEKAAEHLARAHQLDSQKF